MGIPHHPRRAATGFGGSAGRFGEGRAPHHGRGGPSSRVSEETQAVELLQRGAFRGAGQPRGTRLPCRQAEHAVAHGRHPVHHGRLQMLAVAGRRLLRRHGRGMAAVAESGRGHGRRHAARRGRHACRRRSSHHPLGPRLPLPMARVDPHLRGERVGPVDERQGLLVGQRRGRGILRRGSRTSSSTAGIGGA